MLVDVVLGLSGSAGTVDGVISGDTVTSSFTAFGLTAELVASLIFIVEVPNCVEESTVLDTAFVLAVDDEINGALVEDFSPADFITEAPERKNFFFQV